MKQNDDMDWIERRKRRNEMNERHVLDLLRERVRLDEGLANADQEGLLKFHQAVEGSSVFTVARIPNGVEPDRAQFAMFSLAVGQGVNVEVQTLTRKCVDSFTVTHEWDDAADACKLMVDGQAVEPWEVSERALGPLIFSDP